MVVLHILVIIFNHHRKPNISRSCRLFHHFSSSAKPEQLSCGTVVLHDVNYVNYSITDINIRIIIVIIFRIWLVLAGYEKLDGDLKPVRNGEVFCMKKILLMFHSIALIIALFKMILTVTLQLHSQQKEKLSFDITNHNINYS